MELVGNINTNEIDILKTNYNKNKRALQLSDHNIENASRKNILDIADETSNDAVNNFLFNENKTNNIDKSFLIESKQPANTRSYYYDAVGNVLNNNSTYNEFKQLTNDDSYIYTYDDKGNLKTKKSKKDNSKKIYTFNAQNQLLKVETKSKNNNFIKSFVFTYDALNRRVSKTHTSIDNNYSHYYLYDGLNIVAILNNNTKELISTITYDDKIDTPLSITTNNKTYFYSRDHQGNILHLTNENAEIVEEFTYDAYGKITSYHQSEVTLNPYCYTGREFDDVDLYYYRFRYYDPTTKRFLSLDPIGFESGDYNHYRYVFSSPVNYTDPSGLLAFLIPIVAWISQYGAVATAVGVVGVRAVQVGSRVAPHAARAKQTITRAVTKAKNAIKTPVSNMDKSKEDVETEENTKVDGKDNVSISKGQAKDVDCGDYGKFKDQKNPSKKDLERDHIPSQAAMKKRAADNLGISGDRLGSCIENRLKNWAETLALPTKFHEEGRTNKSKNDSEQIELDADDLGDAVDKDVKEYEDKLDDADIPEECKGKIKEALEEIKKKTDEFLNDFIKDQIKHCIDTGKFNL